MLARPKQNFNPYPFEKDFVKTSAPLRTGSLAAALALAALASACSDNSDPSGPGPGPDPDVTSCTTNVSQGDTFVELCTVDGPVRHVQIEGLKAPATHASAQIVFGFSAPPSGAQAALGADQFRLLFYGGGVPAPAALVQASYGSVDAVFDGDASFINTGVTVCFDLYDGSATAAPQFVLWVNGQHGANCADHATLTVASAYGIRTLWHGATGAIAKQTKIYFRQSASAGATPAVTLSTEPALDAAAITAATSCTTTWATNTDWQQLCTPSAGAAHHVRLEGVQSSANNSYFYAILGQDADPTGNPAGSAGKLILTGGRAHDGSSWTWFRFGTGSTTQFNYATDASAALYTQGPSTICFDTGTNDDGNARVVFWATGAKGADCAVPSTLTLDHALYDSTTDPDTASIWSAPFIDGKLNFVKASNANVTIGNVVVSAEPAAL